MDVSYMHEPVLQAVIPTAIIPLTILGVILSAIASAIAGIFGLELKWEGPKRLLEVFLKPRVIVSVVLLNAAIWLGIKGYGYISTSSKPLWFVSYKNRILAQPLNGRNYQDNVYSINVGEELENKKSLKLGSAEQIWKHKLPKGSFAGVVVSGKSLFIGTDNGYVYELDSESGNLLRKFYVGTSATPRPVIWNGFLFAGEGHHQTHGGRIYSFDLKTGQLRGTYQTKGHTEGVPVVASSGNKTFLFVMAGRDGIHAVDPVSLKKVWQRKLGHVDSEVRVEDGKVYFSRGIERGEDVRDHRAYALDFETGNTVWEVDLAASSWRAPVMFSDRLCFGVGEIFVPNNFGQLACYDKKTGAPLVAINMDAPLIGISHRVGDKIITADLRGKVCLVDPIKGVRDWCANMPVAKYSYASASFDGSSTVLFPTASLGILGFDLKSGNRVFEWKPTKEQGEWGRVMSAVKVKDGAWYVVDWDGTARKLKPIYAGLTTVAKKTN